MARIVAACQPRSRATRPVFPPKTQVPQLAQRAPGMTIPNQQPLTTPCNPCTTNTASQPLLALTAALAGCGGGRTRTTRPHRLRPPLRPPAPAPVPSAPIGVNFVLPSNNVLEAGASDGLVVNVSVNGSPAPNGNQRHAGSEPAAAATVAPVAPLHRGRRGRATLSVGSSVPHQPRSRSRHRRSARAIPPDTVTYYVRPTPKIPAGAGACVLQRHRHIHPLEHASPPEQPATRDVQITAIANPHNG